jgi:hypothetical protein
MKKSGMTQRAVRSENPCLESGGKVNVLRRDNGPGFDMQYNRRLVAIYRRHGGA